MKIQSVVGVITGGASGLGKACVDEILRQGGSCAIFDIQKSEEYDKISRFAVEKTLFCKTDVSNEENVQKSIDKTVSAFGAINVLINCAGIGIPAKVLKRNNTKKNNYMDKFNKTLQVNLIGTMNMIKVSAHKMLNNIPNKDGERGVIINTASIASSEGQVGQAAYSASKAGIIGMMLPIAREFANYGIRILTISPGFFNTPMFAGLSEKVKASLMDKIPFPKRLADPSEYASLAMHIIKNPILNGETIRLDASIRM